MTSEPAVAYAWVWLPGAVEPVVAGRLNALGDAVAFTYGRSYLDNPNAISLFDPELPLGGERLIPSNGPIASCIADAGPDAWGQRVILNRLVGRDAEDTAELGPLTYLLSSGSDRVGALDFQESATEYVPRLAQTATLDELVTSAERVQQGLPLTPGLDAALLHGSSIGGARPKASLTDGGRSLIAKFSATSDTYPVVKGEFVAMTLAARVGLDVAKVSLTTAHGRDVLLVQRFDREPSARRRAMVSALTISGLGEMGFRYATYWGLADSIRARFTSPDATLNELFSRITFNIFTGNTDDHPRNHAAFWDGDALTLTPAYDIAPQARTGGMTRQLMAIGRDGWRDSQVAGCIERAHEYHLNQADAADIVARQREVITKSWDEVCDLAELSTVDRAFFWQRQFLNPYSLEGGPKLSPVKLGRPDVPSRRPDGDSIQ